MEDLKSENKFNFLKIIWINSIKKLWLVIIKKTIKLSVSLHKPEHCFLKTVSDTESDSFDIELFVSCNDPSKLIMHSFERALLQTMEIVILREEFNTNPEAATRGVL